MSLAVAIWSWNLTILLRYEDIQFFPRLFYRKYNERIQCANVSNFITSRVHILSAVPFRFIIPALPSINSGHTVACVFHLERPRQAPRYLFLFFGHSWNRKSLQFWPPECLVHLESFKRWEFTRQIHPKLQMGTSRLLTFKLTGQALSFR